MTEAFLPKPHSACEAIQLKLGRLKKTYHAKITVIPKGVDQGQIAASGTLARTTSLGGTTAFPAEMSIPDDMSRESRGPGMSGNATVFAPAAGVIGLLASILVWVSSYVAYL